jgi:hypothetical protein
MAIPPLFDQVEIFVMHDNGLMKKRTVWKYVEIFVMDIKHNGKKHFMLGCAPLGVAFDISVIGVFPDVVDACEAAKDVMAMRNTWTDVVMFTQELDDALRAIGKKHHSVSAVAMKGNEVKDPSIVNGNPKDYN